jgi:hypothetical protein
MLGVPLKPHEFQRVLLIKLGETKLANQLWNAGVAFDEHDRSSTVKVGNAFTFSPLAVNEKLAMTLAPYLPGRSCWSPVLERRLLELEKHAGQDWYGTDERAKAMQPAALASLPILIGLAGAFKLLRDRMPKPPIDKMEAAVNFHPWALPLLFGLGVGATVGLKGLLTPIQMQNQGPVDSMGGGKYAAEKTAVSPLWLQLGALPATYMYSGVQRQRAMRGEPVSELDRFIAERPDISSVLAFVGARGAHHGLKHVRHLVKGASVADLGMYVLGTESKLMPAVLAGAALDLGIFKAIQRIAQRRTHHGNQSQ